MLRDVAMRSEGSTSRLGMQIMQQVFHRPPAPLQESSEPYDILMNGVVGYPDPSPIFVVGMPRSGSTLVEHILSSHPLAHGAGLHILLVAVFVLGQKACKGEHVVCIFFSCCSRKDSLKLLPWIMVAQWDAIMLRQSRKSSPER